MATTSRKVRSFRGGEYVAALMAELSRAAIAQRIATAREQAGLSQPELADLLHIHYRTLQDWESPKKRALPFDRIDEIASFTGVEPLWLLHGEQAFRPSPQQELLRQAADGVADVVEFLPELRERLARIEAALELGEDEQASPGTGTDTP